jgi:hypothetical protein
VYILPIEFGNFYYYLSIEKEEDNIKNYHYAINKETRKMVLLDYNPYDIMTRSAFRECVEKIE